MKQLIANKENVVAQVTARESSIAGNRFSIRLFIIAFAFTGAALAWLSWSTYDSYSQDAFTKGQLWRSEELRGEIIHLDEVLTMSAQMAAATGDPQWEARYRKFEPQLDRAIKDILKLAPSQTLAQTDAANMELVEMENKVFILVRENHPEAARTILSSPKYEMEKGVYALGMISFFEQLEIQLEATQRSKRDRAVFSAGAGITVLVISLLSWLTIMRRMYKAHAALLVSITRRKQTEEVLRKTQRELEVRVQERTSELTIANSQLMQAQTIAKMGSWQWEVATNEFTWSDELYRLFGFQPQEFGVTLETFLALIHPDDLNSVETALQQSLRDKGFQQLVFRIIRPDGTVRTHQSDALVFVDATGRPIKLWGTSLDITERQLLEIELVAARDVAIESARLKSEFLANMSHEIRTPMNGVIGMTGLLLDTKLDEDQREFAETIRFSGEGLLTIINDILDFSKIEAGKLQFEVLDFDLRHAVETTVKLLAGRAHEKKLELACLLNSDVPTNLRGDPGRLREVLTNLIGNAVKFTEQGEVIVRAAKDSETDESVVIRFMVSDTGIGIAESARHKLFLAFTQADGSTTRKYGGTGLGLAISKQLVELMGGQIGVTSEPGKGSTFWFTARLAKQTSRITVIAEPSVQALEHCAFSNVSPSFCY